MEPSFPEQLAQSLDHRCYMKISQNLVRRFIGVVSLISFLVGDIIYIVNGKSALSSILIVSGAVGIFVSIFLLKKRDMAT